MENFEILYITTNFQLFCRSLNSFPSGSSPYRTQTRELVAAVHIRDRKLRETGTK